MTGCKFEGCINLTSIYLLNKAPLSLRYPFNNYDATLYIPQGSLEANKNANIWKEFNNIVEFDPTSIEDVTEDVPTFEVTAGGILFTGAEGKVVAVYTTSGALVEKINAYAGEEITLDKGVYIIRVGNKAVKIKL
ncbi:MAG: T9SS type A sorting domain-containing protein [Bacteroidales bacterium]|nr:T9SS type A sorting domain-containing protein [Bacteroidales bacterium]